MKRKRVDDSEDHSSKRLRHDPWSAIFDGLANQFKQQERDAELQSDDQLFVSPAAALLAQVSIADPFAEIQRRIDKLHETFRSNWPAGKAPYYYQEVMFDHMLVMSMRWIVGDNAEFEQLKPMLMERLGFDRWLKSYDQIMPRQFGKTEGLTDGGGSVTFHLPMRIAIFAQGSRNSEQDLKLMKEAIKRRLPPGQEWRFKVDKVDEFQFYVFELDPRHKGMLSIVKAYPSSGDSKCLVP